MGYGDPPESEYGLKTIDTAGTVRRFKETRAYESYMLIIRK